MNAHIFLLKAPTHFRIILIRVEFSCFDKEKIFPTSVHRLKVTASLPEPFKIKKKKRRNSRSLGRQVTLIRRVAEYSATEQKLHVFCKKYIFTNCLEIVPDVPEGRRKGLLVNEPWNYERWKWKRHIRFIMNCAISVQSYHFSDIICTVLNVWT